MQKRENDIKRSYVISKPLKCRPLRLATTEDRKSVSIASV